MASIKYHLLNTLKVIIGKCTDMCQLCDSYHQDLQLAGCTCKALLYPDETASACSPPPEPLRRGSWHLRMLGTLESCGRPLGSRYIRSADKLEKGQVLDMCCYGDWAVIPEVFFRK